MMRLDYSIRILPFPLDGLEKRTRRWYNPHRKNPLCPPAGGETAEVPQFDPGGLKHMNRTTEILTTLIHYKAMVRDTLEYTLRKDSYDKTRFEERKKAVLIEVDQNTPLKSIIDASGDNGKKLEKEIRDFYDQVYGDSSTILKLADDGLRVDHAQHLAIFKGVIFIHENVESMIRGIVADAKKNGDDVSEAETVDLAEEKLYRGAALLSLTGELVKLFGDYNQAMAENKGNESAASRFIGNDFSEVVRDLNEIRGANRITDGEYNEVQDSAFVLVDHMTGKRDLPVGKSFNDVIKLTQDVLAGYAQKEETAFGDVYNKLVSELLAQLKADGNASAAETEKAEPAQQA
jgi:hypothetical protein